MTLHPIRAAVERGRRQGRDEAVGFLRELAKVHVGRVGDQRRSGALNHAASLLRDGRKPCRPEDVVGVPRG